MSKNTSAPRISIRSTVPFDVTANVVENGVPKTVKFSCVGDHLPSTQLDELTEKQSNGEINNAEIIRRHIKEFGGWEDKDGKPADQDAVRDYILGDSGLCLAVVSHYTKRLLGLVEGNSPKSRRG